jgi:tyrosinase
LTPFWNGQTTFWNSALLGDTTKLGYNYPEFNELGTSDPRAVYDAIRYKVIDLYGWAYSPSSSRFLPSDAVSAAIQTSTTTQTNDLDEEEHLVSSFTTGSNVEHHVPSDERAHHKIPAHHEDPSDLDLFDWTARIECEKYELRRSFSVLLFLGEIPEASEEWQTCSSFVGAYHVFVNSVAERCANCSTQVEFVAEGFVHLDHKILQHSGLGSLEPDVVEPYLTQALQWRVQTVMSC